MELFDFFDEVNSAYRATDDDAPVTGTSDHDNWLSTTNRFIRNYAYDKKRSRSSLFKLAAPYELGTVATAASTALTGTATHFTDYRVGDKITVVGEAIRTIAAIASDTSLTVTVAFANTASTKRFTRTTIIATSVQSYSLNRRFLNPSDQIIVTTTTGSIAYYNLAKPQDRLISQGMAYVHDQAPQLLTFQSDITSTDQIIGGTLAMPGFYLPDPVLDDTDLIPVDDPNWLVYRVAGELATNDLIYESKAADLIAQANVLYTAMAVSDRRGTAGNPSTSRTNVVRIPGSNR